MPRQPGKATGQRPLHVLHPPRVFDKGTLRVGSLRKLTVSAQFVARSKASELLRPGRESSTERLPSRRRAPRDVAHGRSSVALPEFLICRGPASPTSLRSPSAQAVVHSAGKTIAGLYRHRATTSPCRIANSASKDVSAPLRVGTLQIARHGGPADRSSRPVSAPRPGRASLPIQCDRLVIS
jgi:hypothetical protein